MKLNYPVNPSIPISSPFGWRLNPFKTGESGNKIQVWHSGVDFSCPIGTGIYPVYPGEVVFTGLRGNYGLTVIVYHPRLGNVWSLYAHLSAIKLGIKTVKPGEIMCFSGNSGWSTGPHLHLSVRIGFNGILAARNPMEYLTWVAG